MNAVIAPTGQTILTNVPTADWAALALKWEKKTRTGSTASLVHFINHHAHLGYSALLPDDSYRLHPAYSNSRLGQIKAKLSGRTWKGPRRSFVVGTALHELLLEPETADQLEDYMLTPGEERQIHRMIVAANRTEEVLGMKANGQIEQAVFWKDYATRLPCKAKVDIWLPQNSHVADLKSTSARTQAQFEESVKKFDYERQGVYYMDGTRSRSCTFIGVSKIKPHNIFFYTFRRRQRVADRARRRYRFILQKAKLLDIKP